MSKRTSITITPEIAACAKQLKQKNYEKTYSEIYRMILRAGVDKLQNGKQLKASK